MKTLKKQTKTFALFLSIIILLQGCTVYKSTSVSLDQAVKKEQKVKVVTKVKEKLKFKRIGFEEGKYYGVKKVKGEIVKVPLDQNFIDSIREKDKTLSTIATVGVSIVSLLGVLVGVYLLGGGGGYSFSGPLFPPGFTF